MIGPHATALLCALLYSLIVSFSSLEWLFVLPLILLGGFEYTRLGALVKKLLYLNVFILFLTLFVWFADPEEAWLLFARSNLILGFNLLLFANSKGFDIVRGLEGLGFPPAFVSGVYFALTMLHYLRREFAKYKTTLKARGFQPATTLFAYKTYGNLLGMLFVKTILRSRSITQTFYARGFEGRTYLLQQRFTPLKIYLLCATIAGIILLKVLT